MTTQREKCERFHALHTQQDAFIIPNPWDAGSAKILQSLGFRALATTSSGFAYTLGRTDGQPTLEDKLAHCESLANATDIPINADFEDGYADDPESVAANLQRLAETGVAGCSIEDFSRRTRTLFSQNQAVERIHAAAEAVRSLNMPFQLTARAENLLRGVDDLEDTIARLHAYRAAGADVLYAPGIRSLEDLRAVTQELEAPFNVLGALMPDAPLLEASREMLEHGTFGWVRQIASGAEVSKLLVR